MSKKVVLEEDEYVETLGLIIERDFFPDLPKLQKQRRLLLADEGTETALRAISTTSDDTSVRSNASVVGWDQPTPYAKLAAGDRVQVEDDSNSVMASMTLNRFVATHTSEDNESFKELQEKAVNDHQRKYHWAFDENKDKGDSKLHLLANGTWISKDQRKLVDEACAPKGLKDDRPGFPETWRYRARNPLIFQPELEATRDICQIKADSKGQLLLEKDPNSRSRLPPRSRAKTVYANSRFFSNDVQLVESECGGGSSASRDKYSLVPMTPIIAPGVDASPLMTWGDIEATPTILDNEATPGRIWNTPSFEIQDTSRREKVATRLESEARHRNPNLRLPGQNTPLRSRYKAEHTHMSRNVRARMSSVRSALRTPVGSDTQLRASYSTPLRLPKPSSKTRKTR
ncbi:putative nuclear protein DGCR14/ESS-2 [Plasmopara halstedii]